MTVYGYLRVSKDEQDANNQKISVVTLSKNKNLVIDKWFKDEGISGTKEPEERKLGKILKKIKKGDIILASELSRLGRRIFMIFRILDHCNKVGAKVMTYKDGYELGDNIQSKVLAFAFGIAAEIERDMISLRTKEALQRKKAQGVILGIPKGTKKTLKLEKYKNEIIKMKKQGITNTAIGKKYKVTRDTVTRFLKAIKNEL